MNETQQVDFLLALGKRLDNWTVPGDENDHLADRPLWTDLVAKYLKPPARVIDVLCARWIKVKDYRLQSPVNLFLNPAQRDFSYSRSDQDIILKSGRAGFTTYEDSCALLRTITHQGFTAVLVTHSTQSAQDYFTQVRMAYDNLGGAKVFGDALRAGALRPVKNNVRELFFPVLNSHFFLDTAGQYAPAEGQGIQYLICDEMARWLHGDPAQVVSTLLTHRTGIRTITTMLSRPFGQTGEFYERYWAARRGESSFRAHFYPWFMNPGMTLESGRPNLYGPAMDDPELELTAEEIQLCEKYRMWRSTASELSSQ